MKFVYSAGAMGLGRERKWHKKYNFPDFPRVTKTITLRPKIGTPFLIARKGKTVWNRNGLSNPGIAKWIEKFKYQDLSNIILSLAGTDEEIHWMIRHINLSLEIFRKSLNGIELNFFCPNVKQKQNKYIPETTIPLDLKLKYNQDPYQFDLSRIRMIRYNAVSCRLGAISGKAAQKYIWPSIEAFAKDLPISGCSWTNKNELQRLIDTQVSEISIGSVILTNPKLVEKLSSII